MKAKFRFAAVLLALAMVLSASSVLLVACGGNTEPTNPPTVGTTGPGSLVSDEGLVSGGKLKVMYPFEDSGRGRTAAVNPYTGETQADNRGEYISGSTLVANPDSATASQSANALSVRESGFELGKLGADQYASTDAGLSISFWAYNDGTDSTESDETAGTLAFDFMNVVTNGSTTVTWGNIRAGSSDFYPGLQGYQNTITVGRGAYAESLYTRAQAERSDAALSRYSQSYCGYNAIAGNAQTKDNRSSVTELAAEMANKWRYVSIVIDKDVGISFYTNGRLAYCYSSAIFTGATTGGDWSTVYENFVSAIMESQNNYTLNMFNDTLYGDAEVYVDDVIVGEALTAAECEALYENLSGTDVDTSLESTQSDEEQQATDAINAYISEMVDSFPIEGDTYGTEASGSAVGGEDLDGDGTVTDVVGSAKTDFVNAYNAMTDDERNEAYQDVIGNVTCSEAVSLGQGSYYKPTVNDDGTFEMTVSGIQLASGIENFNATYVTLYSGSAQKATVRVDWLVSENVWAWDTERLNVPGDGGGISGNITWKDSADASSGLYLNVIQRYCALDIVFAYDGEDLTITYNIYYFFAGQEVTTDSGVTVTIPKNDDTLFNTVTYTIGGVYDLGIDDVLDMDGLSIKFGSEKSAYLIEGVEGGAAQPDAPASSEIAVPQGNVTVSNSFTTLADTYASVKLPAIDSSKEDLHVEYTADMYMAGGESWHGPAFILVGTEGDSMSVNNIDTASETIVYVRADDYDISKNMSDSNALNINYIQSPLSGAYAYTLSEPIYRLTEGEGYIYTVTPLKLVVTIDQHGDNYLVTYYEGSVDDENIIRQIAVTFVNTNTNLYLVIGGEGTYMENIAVTINGEAATPNRTTSGSKTELSAPPAGYEAIA